MHNCRSSYKWNAAVINSPSEFPARTSQNVACVLLPGELGCKTNEQCVQSQEIKQKARLSLMLLDNNVAPTKICPFGKKGFTQHAVPGQPILSSSVSDWILQRWPRAFSSAPQRCPVKKRTSRAGGPADSVELGGACGSVWRVALPCGMKPHLQLLGWARAVWLMPAVYKGQKQLALDFSACKRIHFVLYWVMAQFWVSQV